MGFSSASAPQGSAPGAQPHMSFTDKLLSSFAQSNPIANSLGGAVFGKHQLGTYDTKSGVTAIPDTSAPPTFQMPQIEMQELPDFLSMNAQPKSGGVLKALLSLL